MGKQETLSPRSPVSCSEGVKVWAYHDYYCLFIQKEHLPPGFCNITSAEEDKVL